MAFSFRTVALATIVAFGPKMPDACNKMLGKSPAATEPPPPPPPPPPTDSAGPIAPPPIWQPPEPPSTVSTTSTKIDAGPPSEAEQAKAALEKKDYKKVRTLLAKKVEGGKGTPDEASMLIEACTKLKDKVCVEKAKNPPPSGGP